MARFRRLDAQLQVSNSVNGAFTFSPPAGTILNVGAGQMLSATFTPVDPVNFNPVSLTRTIDVEKAPLTITAADKTQTYGDPTPQLAATYSGFVNGETAANLDTPATLGTTATSQSRPGRTRSPSPAPPTRTTPSRSCRVR